MTKPFSTEVLRSVFWTYASRLCQDPSCAECEFLPFDDETEIPEGFEALREGTGLTKQCPAHKKPLYPWLLEHPKEAVEWLKVQSEKGPFRPDFAEWEKACVGSLSS